MMMPGRTYSAQTGYRYGFNGKENDNEVKGEGNQQDYGERVYDVRVGRFLSLDPIADEYPHYSPYQFAGNAPIGAVDMDGLEPAYTYYNSQFSRWVSMPAGDNLQRRNIPYEQRKAIPVGSGPNDGGRGVSVLLNVIPVVNEGKGFYESISGKDLITGEELSITDRLLGLIPYAKTEKALNKIKTVKTVTNTVSKTVKTVNKLEEKTSVNRGTGQDLEDVSKRQPLQQAYEDAATGAASDVASRKRVVPTLKYDNPNPNGKNFVKFDGFDVGSKELIDRKWDVTTFDKSLSQLKRMSEALKQNPGFKGVIEVPTQRAYNNAVRAIQKANVTNINVRIVPHNP